MGKISINKKISLITKNDTKEKNGKKCAHAQSDQLIFSLQTQKTKPKKKSNNK